MNSSVSVDADQRDPHENYAFSLVEARHQLAKLEKYQQRLFYIFWGFAGFLCLMVGLWLHLRQGVLIGIGLFLFFLWAVLQFSHKRATPDTHKTLKGQDPDGLKRQIRGLCYRLMLMQPKVQVAQTNAIFIYSTGLRPQDSQIILSHGWVRHFNKNEREFFLLVELLKIKTQTTALYTLLTSLFFLPMLFLRLIEAVLSGSGLVRKPYLTGGFLIFIETFLSVSNLRQGFPLIDQVAWAMVQNKDHGAHAMIKYAHLRKTQPPKIRLHWRPLLDADHPTKLWWHPRGKVLSLTTAARIRRLTGFYPPV